MKLNAQDLSKHQWEDRLVLIIAEEKNEKFQQQLTELQKHQQGLKERKLVIYQILPTKYSTGFEEENWQQSSELYHKYKAEKSDFRVVLIGLDSGRKTGSNRNTFRRKTF